MKNLDKIIKFIREIFPATDYIPLHEPCFAGNEKQYLLDCIDSTFVSSIGPYVDQFEKLVTEYTGAKYAIATVNGTAALHTTLFAAGVQQGDEVITQAITFIGTANAITYTGASPVFLDCDRDSLSLSPIALELFLAEQCIQKGNGYTYNKTTGKKIASCVPVHIFGHPAKIDRIKLLCDKYHIVLVEDAAESLGSLFKGRHTGTFGSFGILSFNGNKTITAGGGGAILTNEEELAKKAKHLTTTAKVWHPWDYIHDQIGFNYRMPNINAALGCAQMERLPRIIERKRQLAAIYREFFGSLGLSFLVEPHDSQSNYWLNAILFDNLKERNDFLEQSNANGIMTRPLWTLIPELPIYSHCQTDELNNARWMEECLVNIPSSATYHNI